MYEQISVAGLAPGVHYSSITIVDSAHPDRGPLACVPMTVIRQVCDVCMCVSETFVVVVNDAAAAMYAYDAQCMTSCVNR